MYAGKGCPLASHIFYGRNSATNQALLLKQSPLSLKGNALEWYMAIPPRSVADWDTMATTFCWAYYRTTGIRRRFLSWERCLEISRPSAREETRSMVGPVDEAIAILLDSKPNGDQRPISPPYAWEVDENPFPIRVPVTQLKNR